MENRPSFFTCSQKEKARDINVFQEAWLSNKAHLEVRYSSKNTNLPY